MPVARKHIFVSGETYFHIRWYNWRIFNSSGISRPKFSSRKLFNLALFSVENVCLQKLGLHKSFCENLMIYYPSWMLFLVDFFLLASCIACICFSWPTCCWTVNFLSATTFVSHILQNSILPSVKKMSSPNSYKIAFKWHEMDGFDLGMVE